MPRTSHASSWIAALLITIAAVLSAGVLSGHSQQKQPLASVPRPTASRTGAAVYGYVFARVANNEARGGFTDIYLPNVTVRLVSVRGNIRTVPSVTNAHGMFTSVPVASGSYQVCWDAEGFKPGCTGPERPITVRETTAIAGPIQIRPQSDIVAGKVTPCFLQDAIFGIDTKTEVSLVNAAGTAVTKPVSANYAGQFVIPKLPRDGRHVRAECDGLRTEVQLNRWNRALTRLEFPTSPLRIASVLASDGDRIVRKAKPGQTVQVVVDVAGAGKENLQYRWFTSDSVQPFASVDRAAIQWTLPDRAGVNTMQVMVTDKRGGRRIGRVSVTTGETDAIFSATVTGAGGNPLKEAEVSVNGTRTLTNEAGYFFLRLPQESARYVLNIRSNGYASASRVLYREMVGARLSLTPAPITTLDPRRPIAIGTGGYVSTAQLLIDANALVNLDGKPSDGDLSFAVSAINLRDPAGHLPGNFAAVDANNQPVRLKSIYGAVDVQVRDHNGQPYNLAAGQTATLRIPVDPATPLTSAAPASAPLWTYDEQAGLWRQTGIATLAGRFYEGQVSHFSAFSVGLAANDAACMRLHVDFGSVNPGTVLNIIVPADDATGANLPAITTPLTVGGVDLIAALPPNEPITLTLGTAELSKQVVNTGAATIGPVNPNPAPATCNSDAYLAIAPNDALGFDPNNSFFSPGGFLNYFGLDNEISADAYYATIDPAAVTGTGTVSSSTSNHDVIAGVGTNFNAFFVAGDIIRAGGQVRTIKHITNPTQLETFTTNAATLAPIPAGSSYERVGEKTTLEKFQQKNEFLDSNNVYSEDASAIYYNAGDLGFGRSMHMKKSSSGTIAYYVSNYPNVEQARLQTGLIATVAMEFSAHPSGGAAYTKFYVYNNLGARINNADLDGRGAKFIPRLCVICHAGTYVPSTPANRGDLGSRFIPFDLESFQYSGFDPTFSRASQEENFRKLNLGVLQNTNPSAASAALINGWYGGAPATAGQTVNDAFVPSGWTTPALAQTLYTDVLKTSCRTCHVNRDAPLDWASFGFLPSPNFGFQQRGMVIEPFVCSMRNMPHAKQTYINFWMNSSAVSSPNRADELRNSNLIGWPAAALCPSP